MNKLDRIIEKVEAAISKDLQTTPVRLSTTYKHYIKGVSQVEKDIRNAEHINRNAPVKVTKIKPAKEKG